MNSTEIIQKMIARDQSGDEAGTLELQTELLQILRETTIPAEIALICHSLIYIPTIPAVPVLMARLSNTQPIQRSQIASTLSSLKTLIHPEDLDPIDREAFFRKQWWQVTWRGPETLFRQYLDILLDLQEINEQQHAEKISDALAKELGITLKASHQFSVSGADLESAITTFIDAINQEMLMCSIYSSQGLSCQSTVEENIRDLRSDYLLTKLGLTKRFRESHALTSIFLSL